MTRHTARCSQRGQWSLVRFCWCANNCFAHSVQIDGGALLTPVPKHLPHSSSCHNDKVDTPTITLGRTGLFEISASKDNHAQHMKVFSRLACRRTWRASFVVLMLTAREGRMRSRMLPLKKTRTRPRCSKRHMVLALTTMKFAVAHWLSWVRTERKHTLQRESISVPNSTHKWLTREPLLVHDSAERRTCYHSRHHSSCSRNASLPPSNWTPLWCSARWTGANYQSDSRACKSSYTTWRTRSPTTAVSLSTASEFHSTKETCSTAKSGKNDLSWASQAFLTKESKAGFAAKLKKDLAAARGPSRKTSRNCRRRAWWSCSRRTETDLKRPCARSSEWCARRARRSAEAQGLHGLLSTMAPKTGEQIGDFMQRCPVGCEKLVGSDGQPR